MRRRAASARVATLATTTVDGRPHLVPVCFALADERVVMIVDDKPKTTTALRRLENIRANPAVSMLIDHYEEEWDQLWWVRIDGRAQVVASESAIAKLLPHLLEKYPQYRSHPPIGPAIVVEIERWVGWKSRK